MSTSPDDLPCRDLVELVTEHLEGALDPVTEQRLVRHLAECDGCQAYVQQIRSTAALAGALPAEAVTQQLRAALLSAFRREAEGPAAR
jgi:anti-sigma factor RsiW